MGFGQAYAKQGIQEFYKSIGNEYFNPHENDIKTLIKSIADTSKSYLDLGCGSGVVSSALLEKNCVEIVGCDPFLSDVYQKRLNLPCLTYTFEDIAQGKVLKQFDTLICCYAMHLVPESYLPNLLYQLSLISSELIILSPHKRPVIEHFWTLSSEVTLNKTKMKIYQTNKG